MSAEADIARARRKPIAEEKMQELLKKARKGATASFTFTHLVQILDKLGWQVEPTYGWTPFHYMYQGEEHLPSEHTDMSPNAAAISAFEKKRDHMAGEASDSLPEPGPETVSIRVIMDVSPVKVGYEGIRLFYYRKWVGTEGVKLVSPRGEEAEFIPNHHDYDRGHRSVTDPKSYFASGGEAWRWLKEVGIEDDVSAALGVEKHIPAAQRTRENTGTCAHCWGNYKLEGGRLVLHGYKRPRWGYVVGECRGVRREPLEKSPEGARDWLEQLHGYLERAQETLAALKSGKVESIEIGKNRFIKLGEPSFDYHLKQEIERAKRDVEEIERDVALYEKVLACWRERPMPKEGELQRGPGFFTK